MSGRSTESAPVVPSASSRWQKGTSGAGGFEGWDGSRVEVAAGGPGGGGLHICLTSVTLDLKIVFCSVLPSHGIL